MLKLTIIKKSQTIITALSSFFKFLGDSKGSLYQKTLRGTFLVSVLRVCEKLLQFIKIIILARLLSPNDFGIFTIAFLSLSALEAFSKTGFKNALIQKKEDIKPYLNTAWTVEVIKSLLSAAILFSFSSQIALFFESPDSVFIIKILALAIVVKGFDNIAIIYFQKELKFQKFIKYQFIVTLLETIATIILAFVFYNAWALALGFLFGNIVRLVMSYSIDPYRPKIQIDLLKLKELFVFGKWIFFSGILSFLIMRGDDIFVGKLMGITALGYYHLAYNSARMVTLDIISLVSDVTFPAFAKIKNNILKLKSSFLKVLQLVAILSFLISGLLIVLSKDFIIIFLGEKWLPMAPAMQILILVGLWRSLTAPVRPVFYALGKPKIITKMQIIRLLILSVLIYPFTKNWGIFGTSMAVFLSVFISSGIFITYINSYIKCKKKELVGAIIYPFTSAIVMCLSLLKLKDIKIIESSYISFFILIGFGTLVYLSVLYLLDKYSGCKIKSLIKENIKYLKN